MGTHRLATHGEEVIMKFFAVLASVLYSGYHGIAAPYAAAYGQDARFAYGAPVTALNAGPVTAAVPALTAAAPVVGAQYAAAYAAPAIAAPAYAAPVAAAAPVVAAAPVAASTSSQFQAQDEFGNLAY